MRSLLPKTFESPSRPIGKIRVSTPIRLLLALLAAAGVLVPVACLLPAPLPLWARIACVVQVGLVMLLLGYIGRLIWEVLRS